MTPDNNEPVFSLESYPPDHKSGYVAIVGKPNAGKSTLLNALLGSKLSITSKRPQTTRHRVIGIYSEPKAQVIFLDTPGLIHPKYKLQEVMMKYASEAQYDADLILYLVEATDQNVPEFAFDHLKKLRKPVILAINKMDLIPDKEVLPLVDRLSKMYPFDVILPISALKNRGIDELKKEVIERLPLGPPFYPKDQISEHPERFFVTEFIREQLFLLYKQEIPYSCAVNIVQYVEKEDIDIIDAEIIVNKDSQKGIIIGKGGKALKKLGTESRKSIMEFLNKKIRLNLHVKVRTKWRDQDVYLKNYGYKS